MRTDASPGLPDRADPAWRIAIVASSYYKEEMAGLVRGAQEELRRAGIPEANITVHPAAGSFEVPLIGSWIADRHLADAMIGLGIIVEGETHHARLLAEQSARGIMDVQLRFGTPFAFEILYVRDIAQARERSAGADNKGAEAARAVLHSLALRRALQSGGIVGGRE